MHYKNNREAREGDAVVVKSYNKVTAGTIHSLCPGATSCNGQVCYPVVGGTANMSINIGDCYHAEDALLAVDAATEAAQVKTDSTAE